MGMVRAYENKEKDHLNGDQSPLCVAERPGRGISDGDQHPEKRQGNSDVGK